MKLKTLPENFPFKIRNSSAMTLMLLDMRLIMAAGFDDGCEFENTSPLAKDKLVERFMEFDASDNDTILLLAWNGQYRTDIFELTREDISKHYR